jgi:hypothetical protein
LGDDINGVQAPAVGKFHVFLFKDSLAGHWINDRAVALDPIQSLVSLGFRLSKDSSNCLFSSLRHDFLPLSYSHIFYCFYGFCSIRALVLAAALNFLEIKRALYHPLLPLALIIIVLISVHGNKRIAVI